MDLLVYLAPKGQVGVLQAKLEQGADVSTERLVLSETDGTFISQSWVTWIAQEFGTQVKGDTILKETKTSVLGTFCVVTN